MELINLTPHEIMFFSKENNVIMSLMPSGTVARVSQTVEEVGKAGEIPITKTVFGKVENLPYPKEDTAYIVSSIVAQRVPDREDVFIPSDSVRDSQGRIIGCRALGRIDAPKREITLDEAASMFGFCDARTAAIAAYHC